jgi:CheY-like chemotaxis protein
MAYGFVKQSGGHIKIYTEPGDGTTIKIYLPRSFQAEVAQPVTHGGPAPRGAETILVVEDDEAVQAVVVDQLTQLGYRVLRAGDAQAALTVLQSGIAVDLLFTDVVMPGPLRSADLARMARQMLPAIGVLFTSGYTQNAIVHGGRLDVDVELLSKPYPRDELARRVRQILNRQAGARTTPAGLSALRILVVEDNLDSLETLCEMLGIMGHDVRAVARAEEAIAMLDNIDVLITDIRLPGMQGPALARIALQTNPRRRIVFVSGGGLPAGLDYQARLLKKPYTYEDLAATLAPI